MARTRPDRDDARVARVPLDRLRAHPQNVRHDLGDLRELASSIAADGVLVPLMAEKRGDVLQLLHGHRRAAAARQAGLTRVPVVIVPEHSDEQAIVLMVAENTSRAGLSAAEKRDAVAKLHDDHGYTYTEVAERLGVAVATVYAWRRGASSVDEVDEVAVEAVIAGRLPADKVTAAERRVAVDRLTAQGVSAEDIAGRIGTYQRQVTRDRARTAQRRNGTKKRSTPSVVSARKVTDVVDRWDGHAPPALLAQLRELTGARHNVTTLKNRRVTG